MGKRSYTKAGKSGKRDNLKQLRQCVEEFASQHLAADGSHSGISRGHRRSRKELRKEARKLKKMRIHAFKQGKPLPTAESLEEDRRAKLKILQEKKAKQQEKQRAQQKKQAEKKKLQEEADRKESEYLSNQKRDEKMLKQLEKNLKMKKNKKSLPSAFIQDGLDYILDVVDAEKIKSLSEELGAEALWKDSENSSDQEDETPVRRKSNSQKQSKNSSDDEEEMEVEDEDCNSSGDDDDDDDDHVDNMDDETDGSEAEMDGSFFTGDDDDDGDDDGDDSEFEDEDNIEDGDGTRLKINEKSVTGSKSDADEKTRRLKALADFVGTASSEEAEVKGILKDKSRTSSKNKDPKQVQFSVLSPNVRTDNKDVVTSADEDLHEDIYGRLRDERGNVVGTVGDQQSSGGVYVPPGKRQQQLERKTEGEDETRKSLANVMLLRQLKGQINRLSESNLQSVGNTVESLYREHSRAETTHVLTSVILDACLLPSLTPPRVSSDIALLVALLHHRIGSEVSFTVLQSVVVRYRQLFEELASAKDSGKQIENALTLLCWFYSFKVISCQLLFDLSKQLVARFNERDVELMLILLKGAGFGMRKDNQEEFKKLLNEVQSKASSTDVNQLQDSSRVKFLLDTLTNIRSNTDLKLLSLDEKQHLQHLHKLLNVYTKGSRECELRVTLDDVLDATHSGKWFVVGAAWNGPKPSNVKTPSSNDNVAVSTVSDKLAKKARKLGMNSEMRRSIFYILATCDNYVDAFEKLIQLSSRQQHQKQREAVYREMVNVVIQLCINEGCDQTTSDDNQDVNMFYVYLLHRFCQSQCKRQVQVAVKFTVRHQIQLVAESDIEMSKVMRLAGFVHHLIAKSIIGLAVLKDVDFINISKRMQQFLKRLLVSLLMKQTEAAIETIFRQIAEKPPLLAKQTQLFLKLFLKRGSDDEELQRRIRVADRAMTSLR